MDIYIDGGAFGNVNSAGHPELNDMFTSRVERFQALLMGLSVYYQKFNDATFDDSGWPGFWAAVQDGSVKLSFPIMRHFPHFVEGIYTLFAQDVQDLWSAVPQNELIADDSAFAPTTNDTMWEVLIGVLDEPGYEPLKNGYANENGTSDYFTVGLLPIMSQMFSSENDSLCTETVNGNSQPCIVSIDGQRYYTRAGLIRLQRVVSNILNTRNTWSSRTTNALLAAASSPIANHIGEMTGANVTGNGLLNWNDNNENVPGTELFTGAATTGCEPQIDLNLKKALSFLMIGMPISLFPELKTQ